ncbi:MAG: hypothetical protein H0X42_12735, partial [Solirubrobacterales bacterium]|nr:hypothetical protein [Solirubrobacterales bacterium]
MRFLASPTAARTSRNLGGGILAVGAALIALLAMAGVASAQLSPGGDRFGPAKGTVHVAKRLSSGSHRTRHVGPAPVATPTAPVVSVPPVVPTPPVITSPVSTPATAPTPAPTPTPSPTPAPTSGPAPSAAPMLEAGFESGLKNWNTAGVGEVMPTVTSSVARTGSSSGRILLTGSQNRSELILGGNGSDSTAGTVNFDEGAEYWYGFSFDIQQMVYGHPGAHNLIMQFKSDGEGSPNFGLQL